MSDRICIMQNGRIVQVGSPRELYDRPQSRYVADFVGKSNFFTGKVAGSSGDLAQLICAGRQLTGRAPQPLVIGQAATLCLRPEQMTLTRTAKAAVGSMSLPVTVITQIFLGEHTEYLVRTEGLGDQLVLVPRRAEIMEKGFEPGEAAFASWQDTAALILVNV